jgi:hypothetical protein
MPPKGNPVVLSLGALGPQIGLFRDVRTGEVPVPAEQFNQEKIMPIYRGVLPLKSELALCESLEDLANAMEDYASELRYLVEQGVELDPDADLSTGNVVFMTDDPEVARWNDFVSPEALRLAGEDSATRSAEDAA